MSKAQRVIVGFISSFLLGGTILMLWGRLGPQASNISQIIGTSNIQAYEEPEAETDNPDQAREFRRLSLIDETGNIPADGLINAKQQIEAMTDNTMFSPEALSRTNWTWIGPGNIGGRIRSIVIHPTDPNIMWVGGVTGGIWKTTDGGSSWFLLEDFMTNMAVTTIVIDLANPNILYAGTGEGFTGNRDISEPRGGGVFKTTDGGTTWTQLAATNTSNWYFVNRLAIHPTNSSILLAATNSGAWRTTDGGTTWTKTYIYQVADINFNPNDGNKVILGERVYSDAAYSTDAGVTWTVSNVPGLSGFYGPRVEVAYAPSNPGIVYASIDYNGGEIWKSIDGGANFTLLNTGDGFLGSQGWYDNIIWVDPTNPNTLIVGGINLWRSTNGGSSLTTISDWSWSPYSAHADQHIIVEQPGFNGTTNTTVYFGNDGGIYRADNVYTVSAYDGWQELNNNLGITQFYGAAGNPTTGKIIGGTQDNGTLLYTPAGGTEGWTTVEGGDGGWAAADPIDGNYLYGEYIYGNIHRSSNGGTSANYIDGQYWDGSAWVYKSSPYLITDSRDSNCNFIAPFVLDPSNNNRLLVGCRSLWRTNDVKAALTPTTGPAWYAIKAPTSGNSNISAVVVSPNNADIIWVGHVNGDVYKTTNGTAATPTWTKVDEMSPNLPNRYVTRITIDKNDNNKAYVTFGGFSEDNIWRTVNGGTNWSDITGGTSPTGLPQLPVRSLVIHPSNSNSLYVGTELGIFFSENGGTTWATTHQGPTNTPVDELFWMNTDLVAVTYGRGLFVQNAINPSVSSIVRAASNPAAAGSSVAFTVAFSEAVTGVSTSVPFNDFTLVTSGITGYDITAVTPVSASVYTVTVDTGSGIGTLGLNIPSSATITDLSGNSLSDLPFTGEVYTIDIPSPVSVTIGGNHIDTYDLFVGQSSRQNYPTLDAGPVVVMSTDGTKIVVALREMWNNQATGTVPSTSFAQIMGISKERLSDTYYLPHYNDLSPFLDAQLRFGNVDTFPTKVTITIGGVDYGPFPSAAVGDDLDPGESYRINFPTVDAGPVIIKSSNGARIVASLREMWNNQATGTVPSTSFTQLMGIPKEELSDTYYLPHYNDLSPFLDAQLRFGNVDTVPTKVTITIGGVDYGPFPSAVVGDDLDPGESYRINFPTVDAGPVIVKSSNGAKIVVALREMWNNQATGTVASTSFAQIMGIPKEKLTDTYYLPHYNDLSPFLDAQLRFGNVDTLPTKVTITIGGVDYGPFPSAAVGDDLDPGESYRINFPTVDAGPVIIKSSNGAKIVVALREMWNNQATGTVPSTSFTQLMGIPKEELSDTYYLPHYNDLSPFLDAQLRFGVP